jgi:hypothetical protein
MNYSRHLLYLLCSVSISLAIALPPGADASPYSDDLAKCLVRSTTTADKTTLVQWMFGTASLHPDVKWMAKVSDTQRQELNRSTAKIFSTLLTQTCVSETQQALKYEGPSTLVSSFTILGQVASRELFTNPDVAAAMSELNKYIDKESLQKKLRNGK